MILFVFEGERREPMLFRSIEFLFFPSSEKHIVCSFGNNIYELYRQMYALGDGADIAGVLKENGAISDKYDMSDFSDIFLFFDLDIHNENQSPHISAAQISEMLSYFDNETENGKLFINYPMIESIYHTGSLPDNDYWQYSVNISDCSDYKRIARNFPPYSNLDHLCVTERNKTRNDIVSRIRINWIHLVGMNIRKANLLCQGKHEDPIQKENISQSSIFSAQLCDFIMANHTISVLNAFPLFLYDYFKPEFFRLN